MSEDLKLYQFPISHFCEKARWALDYKGIPYQPVNLIPLAHVPTMLLLSGQTKVPVLKRGEEVVVGSSLIMETLEHWYPDAPSLYPESVNREEILEWVAFADSELGPHVRRVCYYRLLGSRRGSIALLGEEQGWLKRAGLELGFPVLREVMRKGMKINAEGYRRSLDRLNRALDELETQLGKKQHLCGGHFTAADLTVAALLAPLARPARTLYARSDVAPEPYLELCELFTERRLVAKTRQWYAQFRTKSS